MRKILILSFLLFLSICSSAQSTIIKNDSIFNRFIFSEEHFIWISIPFQKVRYTPTMEDILAAEDVLNNNLRYLEKHQMEQNGLPPYIYRCLKCYDRQYFGFINKKEERILFVNFIWSDRYPLEELEKDIFIYYDGGSYYWSIFINITKKELFKMNVNGVS